jgi:hypothetical protein
LPLCPVIALHLPGRCHCVSCKSRRWRGPCVPYSHGRGVAPHSSRPLAQYVPLFPVPLSALVFVLVPVPDPPSLSRFSSRWCVARTFPYRANPILSFLLSPHSSSHGERTFVTEHPNYDGPHVPVIVIMTSDSRTYVPHNLKGLLSSEQDPITGVLQYYNSLFKILTE